MGIVDTAQYKSGNILSYVVLALGVYLLANAALLSGTLFVAGGVALMPRVGRYLYHIPSIIGWGLVLIGLTALP